MNEGSNVAQGAGRLQEADVESSNSEMSVESRPIPNIISRWIEWAERHVGTYARFVALATYAVCGFLWNWYDAILAAIGAFAIVGAGERFHMERKASLIKRCRPTNKPDFFLQLCDRNRSWKIKILKELTHEKAGFKVLGFEQKPVPFGISEPLCTECGNKLVERASVFFPGIVRIMWVCNCGYKCTSKRTLYEVKDEAARFGGLFVQESEEP